MIEVVLPELGEGIKSATVSYWYFKEGQKLTEKDELVELATDKATFNLPSPGSGTLVEIVLREGDSANIGDVRARIKED
jgi:pyruvate/2-oxoglutarate dehydrogenase complex dihydrolipoamide acyltransferase (E2) component